MANYPVNKIRNVCLMGHGGDGKTSLVESLLNIAGVTDTDESKQLGYCAKVSLNRVLYRIIRRTP